MKLFNIFKKNKQTNNPNKLEINIDKFWKWFLNNESYIIENLKTNPQEVIYYIDFYLKQVFPYFKQELEFQLGYNNGNGEFFFFHFGNKKLMKDSMLLKNRIPKELSSRWRVILEN